jgi:hypothetical protein
LLAGPIVFRDGQHHRTAFHTLHELMLTLYMHDDQALDALLVGYLMGRIERRRI